MMSVMELVDSYFLLRNPRTDVFANSASTAADSPASLHFTQGEDFFIRLPSEIQIPHFPIHHDVRNKTPSESYVQSIRSIIGQIQSMQAQLFSGLSFVFDPSDVLHPLFMCVYRIETQSYLYLMKLDLGVRHQHSRIVQNGDNDTTASYRTQDLFLECDLIPLSELIKTSLGISFKIQQSISETWIGETGRGYFVQGIWLDRDLTKFFSRLFVPSKKRLYPYYPFNCKYRAVCAQVVRLDSNGRKRTLSQLHVARQILEKNMSLIEHAIHHDRFSEELESFQKLKQAIGNNSISDDLTNTEIKSYLNAEEQKEYELLFNPV